MQKYVIQDELEAEAIVNSAIAGGADVVLGGVLTTKTARQKSFPAITIDSGSEGILQAALEKQNAWRKPVRLKRKKAAYLRPSLILPKKALFPLIKTN